MGITDKKFTTKVIPLVDSDLQIKVKGNEIVLIINRHTLFTTLSNRENIIGLINAKTKELIQKYLENMSEVQKKQNIDKKFFEDLTKKRKKR